MADTEFTDQSGGTLGTLIQASWLNAINDFFYTLFAGATTAAQARTALGLGTIATQAANSVAITGGSITGITDLAVADGGTGASSAAAARTNLGAIGNLTAITTITANGTYTPTAGTTKIYVIAQGPGGGGGGSGSTDGWHGGGGSAGGRVEKLNTSVAGSYTCTVPAGGAGGTALAAGSNASNTVFTDGAGLTLTAGGGLGGPVGSSAAAPAAGGTATGGDLNIPGNAAPGGSSNDALTYVFGGGANSSLGSGALATTPNASGVANGTGYGSGGAAGNRGTTTSRTGSAGQPGLIIVYEYS